jgi:hypothetical protein
MSACADYRRALLSDPRGIAAELIAHGRECAECAAYAERAARFEARLANALNLNCAAGAGGAAGAPGMPGAAGAAGTAGAVAEVIPLRRRDSARRGLEPSAVRSRWFAVAATFAVAAATAGLLWIAVPRASLAGDVVSHMAEEPAAWRVTDAAVAPTQLREVLLNTHMRLGADAGLVSYASSCEFRGHQVPHLVVQDESGPVTVMVLVHESVRTPVDFDEQGYRGVILPMPGHGAIAVLTRNQAVDPAALGRIAARLESAIEWTG